MANILNFDFDDTRPSEVERGELKGEKKLDPQGRQHKANHRDGLIPFISNQNCRI